ncbi:MAG: hypothetical protein QOF89_330 [Acidobacteriota bacterium]|jgi:hypothetical protein|nr:hypothetical protein [Acidobacteriota bacterium]
MAPMDCQVVIIDDTNVNERLSTLARHIGAVLAGERNEGIALTDGPRWPAFKHPRQEIPVVAFVHWSEGAAQELVRDLKSISQEFPDYGERIAAIVVYRGERELIAPVMKRLSLAPKPDSELYALVTRTGREIPVLPLDRPVVSGGELDAELIQEILSWAASPEGAVGWKVPLSLRPQAAWLPITRMLLQCYLAARSPARLDVSPELARASCGYAEKVLEPEFWSPLAKSFAMMGSDVSAKSGPPAMAKVLERLRGTLKLSSRSGSAPVSSAEWDEEVWQLWSECERLRTAR